MSSTTTGLSVPTPTVPSTQTFSFTYKFVLNEASPFIATLESIETSVMKLFIPFALITNRSLATVVPSLVPNAILPEVSYVPSSK